MFNRSPFNRVAFNSVARLGSALTKALADTVTPTDSLSKLIKPVKSDTSTPTDALIKAVQTLKTDNPLVTETLKKTVGKFLSDTITVTDAMTYFKGIVILLNDTVSLSDNIHKALSKSTSDVITLADLVQLVDNHVLGLADTVTIIDNATFLSGVGYSKSLNDTIPLTDSLLRSIGLNKADTIALLDQLVTTRGILRNYSDNVALADQIFDMAVRDTTAKWIGETAAGALFNETGDGQQSQWINEGKPVTAFQAEDTSGGGWIGSSDGAGTIVPKEA